MLSMTDMQVRLIFSNIKILQDKKTGFYALSFFTYRKIFVKQSEANKNCKAILGGQNAGFALIKKNNTIFIQKEL